MNFAPYQPLPRINEGLKLTGWMPAPRQETYELKISDVKVREKLDRITQRHEIDPLDPALNRNSIAEKLKEGELIAQQLYMQMCEKFMADRASAERSNPMINLQNLMKLVENNTTVRIECKEEEMLLTPHRLAVYGEHMVEKLWVNCQGELTIVLTDDKPMHCR